MSTTTSTPDIRTSSDLEKYYGEYINAINSFCASAPSRPPTSTSTSTTSEPTSLNPYLSSKITHNDKILTPAEYHNLIIPGSIFKIVDILADVPQRKVSARLDISLSDGREVKEFVWYKFDGGWGIERVWSMVEFL